MTSFALIGAAGYVAPRHMKAIKAVGGDLRSPSIRTIPSASSTAISPTRSFFVEFERFDRHIDKLRRAARRSITCRSARPTICTTRIAASPCAPAPTRSARSRWCSIPGTSTALPEIERDTGRADLDHPATAAASGDPGTEGEDRRVTEERIRNVDLTYITSRGRWYHASWKGDEAKSGGVATNIGVHFFDMLSYVFGPRAAQHRAPARAANAPPAISNAARADVRWFLSVDRNDLPASVAGKKTTFRSITVDGEEVEFSEGFTDLHTRSYEEIVAGRGFGSTSAAVDRDRIDFRNAPDDRRAVASGIRPRTRYLTLTSEIARRSALSRRAHP